MQEKIYKNSTEGDKWRKRLWKQSSMTERALAEGQDSGPYPATKQPCGLRKPAFPFWDSVSPYVAAWNWTVGLSYPTFYGSMKSSKADHSPVDLNISSELLMCSWNIDSLWSFVFPASPPTFYPLGKEQSVFLMFWMKWKWTSYIHWKALTFKLWKHLIVPRENLSLSEGDESSGQALPG